jgi:hypothetical protein
MPIAAPGFGFNSPADEFTRAEFRSADAGCKLATITVWVGSVAVCAWLAGYILFRSFQTHPLDAFEEYELQRASRWLEGIPLYGSPEAEAFPEAYPPLYFWVLAGWTRVVGESWFALRSLSLLALAGVIFAMCWAQRELVERRLARLISITVLLTLHALTGKWFEVGKPDTLLAMFLAIGIVTGEHRSWREAAVSTLALWLASLTKQNAPLFVLPLAAAHLKAGRWRWAVGWGAAMSLFVGGSYALLDWSSAGQFFHWVFVWTARHSTDVSGGAERLWQALVTRGPILLVVLGVSFMSNWRCRWTWCLVTALGVALLGMSKQGGLENHLLPTAFIGAVIAGRWIGELWSKATVSNVWRWRLAALPALALAVWPGLPRASDFRWIAKRAREAEEWTEAVRRLPGRVAVSHHMLLARQAGAECPFSDLILKFPGLVVSSTVGDEISSQRFDYLVLAADPEKSSTPGWSELVSAHYTPCGELDCPDRSGVLPRRLYVARRELAQ